MISNLKSDRRRGDRAAVQKFGGTFRDDSLLARIGLSHSYPFRALDCSTTGMRMASYKPLDLEQRFVFRFPTTTGG